MKPGEHCFITNKPQQHSLGRNTESIDLVTPIGRQGPPKDARIRPPLLWEGENSKGPSSAQDKGRFQLPQAWYKVIGWLKTVTWAFTLRAAQLKELYCGIGNKIKAIELVKSILEDQLHPQIQDILIIYL
jgi:hypothetical protein